MNLVGLFVVASFRGVSRFEFGGECRDAVTLVFGQARLEDEAFAKAIASTIPIATSWRYRRTAAAIIIHTAVMLWPQCAPMAQPIARAAPVYAVIMKGLAKLTVKFMEHSFRLRETNARLR